MKPKGREILVRSGLPGQARKIVDARPERFLHVLDFIALGT
jgi:hypothetical protein